MNHNKWVVEQAKKCTGQKVARVAASGQLSQSGSMLLLFSLDMATSQKFTNLLLSNFPPVSQ
jgi:hypothetical protein